MFYVIFESIIHPTAEKLSFTYYTALQSLLSKQSGFISEVPFQCVDKPEIGMLFATFVDEDACYRWRVNHTHLRIQRKARESIFDWYRIRVGPDSEANAEKELQQPERVHPGQEHVLVIYQRPAMSEGAQPPKDLESILAPGMAADRVLTDLDEFRPYQSAANFMWLSSWPNDSAAIGFEKSIDRVADDSVLRVHVVRDYGKLDRKEAPGDDNEKVAAADDDEGQKITESVASKS